MEVETISFDVCGVVFGIPYTYMRDAVLMRETNDHLTKDGNPFIINAHKFQFNIFIVSA